MLDPAQVMRDMGYEPDPWQTEALRSRAKRVLMLCCRQAGKSQTTGCIALHSVLYEPGSLVLLVSRTERQSGELYAKVRDGYERLGRPVEAVRELTLGMELANGSRVLALPGDPLSIRGFSGPSVVVVDEAALVDDELFGALLPMLAVSQGRLICLSTPLGARGQFWDWWENGGTDWQRIKVRASECPRISAEFLAEQRRNLSPRWYEQEFECRFVEASGQVFPSDLILAAFDSDEPPLFAKAMSHAL
jgi:hypothetical protein